MSIDTAEKRFSAINPGNVWRGVNAFPDGVVLDTFDRIGIAYYYSGFATGTAYDIQALSGSFSMSGSDAILTPTTHINTSQERFSAINIGNPWRGLNTFPGQFGTINRIGRANLYSGFSAVGNTYTIICESGSFVWDGEPSFSDFEVTAQAGSFSMTGNTASLIATRTAFLSSGSFVMTGNDANLIHFIERTMLATSGVFTMTGNSASFSIVRSMSAASGEFTMTGFPANLKWASATGQDLRPVDFSYSGGYNDRPRKTKKQRRAEFEESIQSRKPIKPKKIEHDKIREKVIAALQEDSKQKQMRELKNIAVKNQIKEDIKQELETAIRKKNDEDAIAAILLLVS